MAQTHLSLGSNLGDRLGNLRRAIEALAPEVVVRKVSSVYESKPMYLAKQSLFYNIALEGETKLPVRELFQHIKKIEQALGRSEALRNSPREIDIDILFYDDLILDTDDLTIPHPRMHERLFVMVPLEEIAPMVVHPVQGRPIVEIRSGLGPFGRTIWEIEERL